ncbi:MAG: YadA-like family protein, partial [Negativicoccus succinicivorans]|nr:YadA-like family protein [Negativicoccus succinicivorans]
GKNVITNVAAGTKDTDAVNVAQLKAVEGKITQTGKEAQKHTSVTEGTNISVVQDGLNAEGGKNYKVSLAENIDLGQNGSIKAGNTTINNNGLTVQGGPSVTTDGIDAGKNVITNVAAGTKDTDAVNVSQLKAVQEIAAAKTTIEAGDNIKVEAGSAKGSYKISATNTYTTGGTYDAVNKKITFTRNDNQTYDVNLADFVGNVTDTRNTIVDSDTVTVEAKAQEDGSNEYKLNVKTNGKVAKDNKGIVTGGTVYNETRIENDGNYIKAGNTAGQNLIALDKQVGANTTNIAELNNRVYDMGNRVDRVGAGAAALAGLHPLDFDPDDKWDFAAGYGNYKGAHALAIGAFYRPNESKMFSVGGSFGGGENMLNIGFSMKVGRGNEYMKLSRSEMAQQLDAQAKKLDEQAQKLDAQTQKLDAQDEQIRDMQAEMKAITQKLATLQAQSGK